MGATDGAEVAEITGMFLQSQLNEILGKQKCKCHGGLYRDDGLIYIEKANGPLLNRLQKELHKLFKAHGMKITIEQVGRTCNFLDTTLTLEDGSYRPYRKPNSNISYVNRASNHPPSIIRNIPTTINKRLCKISGTEKEFNDIRGEYQEALNQIGYKE